MDIHFTQQAMLQEIVTGQKHDLLRCTTTFDRCIGSGENGISRLGIFDALPGVGGGLEGVVGSHPIFAEGFLQALYLAPIELNAGSYDHVIISVHGATFTGNLVLLRLKSFSSRLNIATQPSLGRKTEL